MAITIENSTAEAIYEALKQVPESELERLRAMLMARVPVVDDNTEWSEADMQDFSNASMRYAVQSFGEDESDLDDA